jgi:hypothetical protein
MSDKKKKKPTKKVKKVELKKPEKRDNEGDDLKNKDRCWRYAWERPWKPGLEIKK